MNNKDKQYILNKAKDFFKEVIVENHKKNTQKLKLKDFNINPFLVKYLANYLTGSSNPEDIAKALVYPRVLGTSINTSFGTNLQKFCTTTLEGFSSTTSGIDIEFIDHIDGRKKYCQIKAGPNTINKDDIKIDISVGDKVNVYMVSEYMIVGENAIFETGLINISPIPEKQTNTTS